MSKQVQYIGKVIEILLDKYIIRTNDLLNMNKIAVLRGNIKKKIGQVNVGDDVKYSVNHDLCTVEDVISRKTMLIRPPVSNIDQLILVISLQNPSPDYLLLDKEIILCMNNHITPIICINKSDLIDELNSKDLEYIKNIYGKLGIKIIIFSAKTTDGLDELKFDLQNKISAFSGQSGVGKSSITTLLIDKDSKPDIEVGELTKKLNKGKHTTKHIRLFSVDGSISSFILDTPGFSSYDLYGVDYKELKFFYKDFEDFRCKYDDCNHLNESEEDCEVKKSVKINKIDMGRYERYVYLYNKLKEQHVNKYK